MSSGRFIRSKYETDDAAGGLVVPCKVLQPTLDASFDGTANAAPEGNIDFPASATTSQGRRSAGVNMRTVTISWNAAPPAGYAPGSSARIPVLTPATFAAWQVGTTGTYLGTAATVSGRSPEVIK